jgi:hypothetical protein
MMERPIGTIQEIERAIDALTPQQIEELYVWLDRRCPQHVDAQLKADLDAGRIDNRIYLALGRPQSRKHTAPLKRPAR